MFDDVSNKHLSGEFGINGFRDKRSTTDAIFILHSVIQKILSRKSKLFCIFIDYEKAFDTVIRDSLWVKLVQSSVSCKMLTMIKSIYTNVKSCVRLSSDIEMSEFFDVTLGLKQGEPLSPILFILFINDIVNSIDFNILSDNDLKGKVHEPPKSALNIAEF